MYSQLPLPFKLIQVAHLHLVLYVNMGNSSPVQYQLLYIVDICGGSLAAHQTAIILARVRIRHIVQQLYLVIGLAVSNLGIEGVPKPKAKKIQRKVPSDLIAKIQQSSLEDYIL